MKYLWLNVIFILSQLPNIVSAQEGLVPCGGAGQDPCETCHFYVLTADVFAWIFGVAAAIVAVIIVVGGLRLVSSGGNQMAKRDARKWIGTAIVGFVLVSQRAIPTLAYVLSFGGRSGVVVRVSSASAF